jgi:hypothetical protein
MAVSVQTEAGFRSGTPQRLFGGAYQTPAASSRGYDVSADDRQFVMIKQAEGVDGGPPQIVVVLNWLEELERLVPAE